MLLKQPFCCARQDDLSQAPASFHNPMDGLFEKLCGLFGKRQVSQAEKLRGISGYRNRSVTLAAIFQPSNFLLTKLTAKRDSEYR